MQNLYKIMGEQHIIMSFVSDFSREKFENLLALVKDTINKPTISFLTQKRLYAITVESLDNIVKYINSTNHDDLPIYYRSNLFIITEQQENYSIKTGSYIVNNQIKELQNQIDKVNSLTKEQLKQFYLDKLLISKPKGGGLGIIEMALKTNNKINYEFLHETETISLLIIHTNLPK